MSARGSVYSWGGCRDPVTGGRLGSRCPQRGKPGHGSWYPSLELPAGLDGHRRIRRGGFPTKKAAEKALVWLRMPETAEAVLTTGEWLDRWLAQRTRPREGRGVGAHRDPPPVAVWTAAQTAGFLNAIRGHRLYAAHHLIALRGLRRGEAAGLCWRDIDLDGATAIIACQLQQYDEYSIE